MKKDTKDIQSGSPDATQAILSNTSAPIPAATETHRQRVTLSIQFDLESHLPRMESARRQIELAAAEIMETARERVHEKESVRIDSCAMRSSVTPVPVVGGQKSA